MCVAIMSHGASKVGHLRRTTAQCRFYDKYHMLEKHLKQCKAMQMAKVKFEHVQTFVTAGNPECGFIYL